jgi:molybdopterin-synthase adenylyltransferase
MSVPSRYSRQVAFSAWGEDSQLRLAEQRVLVIGLGALGSHMADQLARAGVGHLRLVDRDYVELHNLQRQSLYDEDDAANGRTKAFAAATRLSRINSSIAIDARVQDVNSRTITALLHEVDLVLDGTDNFETRYLINEACVARDVPWIYGGSIGSEGIVMPIVPGLTSCLRCIFEDMPEADTTPTCETAGVLAAAVATTASLQVALALRMLGAGLAAREAKRPDSAGVSWLHGLTMLNVWTHEFRRVRSDGPRTNCPTCGAREFGLLARERDLHVASLCGRNSVHIVPREETSVDLLTLAARLTVFGQVSALDHVVRLRLKDDGCTITIFADGRAIVAGTSDLAEAKELYARVIADRGNASL